MGLADTPATKMAVQLASQKLIVALGTKLREGQRRAGDGQEEFEYEF